MTHEEYCKKLREYSAKFVAARLSCAMTNAYLTGESALTEICEIALKYAETLIEMQEARKAEKNPS